MMVYTGFFYLGHRNIQHTVRYTELAPERFKNFWRNSRMAPLSHILFCYSIRQYGVQI